jgi:hypothetical protein
MVSITLLKLQQQKPVLFVMAPYFVAREFILLFRKIALNYGIKKTLQIHTNTTSENKLNRKTIYHGTEKPPEKGRKKC